MVRKYIFGDFYQLKHRISQILLLKCITKWLCVVSIYTLYQIWYNKERIPDIVE